MSLMPKCLVFLLMVSTSLTFAGSNSDMTETLKHLDQAEKSAEAGNLVEASKYTGQAKQNAIMHSAKHPLHKSGNQTPNQKLSRAHSDEAFVNINNAQSLSEKGDKNGTIKAIEATEKHLIQEQKVDLKIK